MLSNYFHTFLLDLEKYFISLQNKDIEINPNININNDIGSDYYLRSNLLLSISNLFTNINIVDEIRPGTMYEIDKLKYDIIILKDFQSNRKTKIENVLLNIQEDFDYKQKYEELLKRVLLLEKK